MITISTRIEEQILKEIDKIAKENNLDRGALIRKYILDSYQRNLIQKNLELVHLGEISIGQAAINSGVSIYQILEMARQLDIEIGADNSTLPYEFEIIKKHLANEK
jgi:hypothetical protein